LYTHLIGENGLKIDKETEESEVQKLVSELKLHEQHTKGEVMNWIIDMRAALEIVENYEDLRVSTVARKQQLFEKLPAAAKNYLNMPGVTMSTVDDLFLWLGRYAEKQCSDTISEGSNAGVFPKDTSAAALQNAETSAVTICPHKNCFKLQDFRCQNLHYHEEAQLWYIPSMHKQGKYLSSSGIPHRK